MTYEIIPKSAIPPTPTYKQENYGEWLAMARHMRIAPAGVAFAVQLGNRTKNTATVSMHGAAKRAGVRVSTSVVGDTMYVVRRAICEPVGSEPIKFTCVNCGAEEETSQPLTKYCTRKQCKAARVKKNSLKATAKRSQRRAANASA